MVNWQKTDYYKEMKAWERDSGQSVADINRINNPNGVHSVGGMVVSQLPSIFMTVATRFADGSFGGRSGLSAAERDANAATTAEMISKDIDNILNKYKSNDKNADLGIKNIDDLEAHFQGLLDDADVSVSSLEKNIKANEEVLNLTNRNAEIDTRLNEISTLLGSGENSINTKIENIDKQIQAASANGEDTSELQSQKQELLKQKEELEKEKTKLETEKAKNLTEIAKAKEAITLDTTTLKKFQDIYEDLKDLKSLTKQLKKAEGKDTIESLTNNQTADIADLIKKMNNAQIKGDKDKADKYKNELKNVLEEYVKNPDNKNQTILKYAKQLGIQ